MSVRLHDGRRPKAMHELSLVQGVLDSVTPVAQKSGAERVTSVTLNIGEMTQVVDEAMRFAWDCLTQDEPFYEGAELIINYINARSRCFECGEEFEHDRFHMKCPACGSRHTVVVAGKEMDIASITVDIPDEDE